MVFTGQPYYTMQKNDKINYTYLIINYNATLVEKTKNFIKKIKKV